jgi:DNA repair exonuclease SbcCD ATPase subunit
VSYASVNELNGLLDQLKQTSQTLQVDLAKVRIDRWKTDSGTKKQVQSNVESIQRNLQSALPEMITQLNNSPEDLAASFKLYRNLDALYNVFGTVMGYAEGLGSKDEVQSLNNDMSGLESARRSFGERMQRLALSKEEELSRLRTQVRTLQAAVAAAPPKKVVVDDTEPPKKPAPKKKPATKPATTDTTKPPANAPPAQ